MMSMRAWLWVPLAAVCVAACTPSADAPPGPTAEDLAGEWTALCQSTDDPQDTRGPEIAARMAEVGPHALDPILQTLEDPQADPRHKVLAIISLRGYVAQEHLGRLIALLGPEHDATTRACAGELLSDIRHPDVAAALAPLADDPDSRIRLAALAGLSLNGDADARARMTDLYREEGTRPLEKLRILDFVCNFPLPEDTALLNEALADTSLDMEARVRIAEALGEVGDESSVTVLRRFESSDDPALEDAAHRAVATIQLRRAIESTSESTEP